MTLKIIFFTYKMSAFNGCNCVITWKNNATINCKPCKIYIRDRLKTLSQYKSPELSQINIALSTLCDCNPCKINRFSMLPTINIRYKGSRKMFAIMIGATQLDKVFVATTYGENLWRQLLCGIGKNNYKVLFDVRYVRIRAVLRKYLPQELMPIIIKYMLIFP